MFEIFYDKNAKKEERNEKKQVAGKELLFISESEQVEGDWRI